LAGDIGEADKHVFGDVRRKVRFPNTLNGNNYATPLPSDFYTWSLSDVIEWAKAPRDVEYDVKPVNIFELSEVDVSYLDFGTPPNSTYQAPISVQSVLTTFRDRALQRLS